MKAKSVLVKANAKINLTLDVLRKRPDGYHDMYMIMQSVDLCDDVRVSIRDGSGITAVTNRSYLPNGEDNLAYKAAREFMAVSGMSDFRVAIDIRKRIPASAGLSGGSADAAAVLKALNSMLNRPVPYSKLLKAAESVGLDAVFCFEGGTKLATGRGEVLSDLSPLPECQIVIIKPDFSASTPRIFEQIDSVPIKQHPDSAGMIAALERGSLTDVARRCFNVFENALPPRKREKIFDIKNALLSYGALGVSMSGTGSAVYGIFDKSDKAAEAYRKLGKKYEDCFLTKPTNATRH